MRNIKYRIILCLLLTACNAQKVTKTEGQQLKESYLYAFKMGYFKSLLLEGFNRSDEIKNVLLFDRSGYGDQILSTHDIELIDSLVKMDNKVMVQDSLNSIGQVGEGAEGKHVFDYALGKYQSNWLDSIAKARLKIYKDKQGE
jgi:hypothetical protein